MGANAGITSLLVTPYIYVAHVFHYRTLSHVPVLATKSKTDPAHWTMQKDPRIPRRSHAHGVDPPATRLAIIAPLRQAPLQPLLLTHRHNSLLSRSTKKHPLYPTLYYTSFTNGRHSYSVKLSVRDPSQIL